MCIWTIEIDCFPSMLSYLFRRICQFFIVIKQYMPHLCYWAKCNWFSHFLELEIRDFVTVFCFIYKLALFVYAYTHTITEVFFCIISLFLYRSPSLHSHLYIKIIISALNHFLNVNVLFVSEIKQCQHIWSLEFNVPYTIRVYYW